MTEEPLNPIVRKPMHPGRQLLVLIGILFLALFVGAFIAANFIAVKYGTSIGKDLEQLNLDKPHVINALWIFQFISTTLPILVTPLIFAYAIVRDPGDYLKNNFSFHPFLFLLAILVSVSSTPLIELLSNLNQQMVLPTALKGVEEWMRQSENFAQKASNAMMQMPTFSSMLFDLLFVGLLTAVIEEILFRGCIQTVLFRWTKNTHAAVWITAIMFSAFHQEFYGFLPRVLLGAMFGYLAAWSGSVWPAIIAHFVNNGAIVVWEYLFQNKITSINPDTPQMFNNAAYLASFAAVVVLLLISWYISKKWQSMHYGEELD